MGVASAEAEATSQRLERGQSQKEGGKSQKGERRKGFLGLLGSLGSPSSSNTKSWPTAPGKSKLAPVLGDDLMNR